MRAGAKIQVKVFLQGDLVRALDETARRTRKPKSEIVRAAVASYLSPDSADAKEAAIVRRLDRMSRQLERLERDLTISNEAIALYVKTWLRTVPPAQSSDSREAIDSGRERDARFIEALGRRLSIGGFLRDEVALDQRPDGAGVRIAEPTHD